MLSETARSTATILQQSCLLNKLRTARLQKIARNAYAIIMYLWFTAMSGVSDIQNAKISGKKKLTSAALCLRSLRKNAISTAPTKKAPLICIRYQSTPVILLFSDRNPQ